MNLIIKKKKFSALFQIHPNILFVRFQFYIICLIVFPNTVPLSYNPSQIVPMLHVSCLLFMSICKNVRMCKCCIGVQQS